MGLKGHVAVTVQHGLNPFVMQFGQLCEPDHMPDFVRLFLQGQEYFLLQFCHSPAPPLQQHPPNPRHHLHIRTSRPL